jgi:Protein of unknown function (DUF1579)
MKKHGIRLTVAAILLIAVAPLAAQEKGRPAAPPGPGEQHKQLDALAGSWDVSVTYRLGGKEFKGTALCEAKWVLDGRFLRQEYHSKMQGKDFIVLQFLGYDQGKKKFVELKMDSMDTGVMHNEGTISNDGKVITCKGERIDQTNGELVKIRTVTTIEDADHFTLEWFLTKGDGKEERAVVLNHTRKKQ